VLSIPPRKSYRKDWAETTPVGSNRRGDAAPPPANILSCVDTMGLRLSRREFLVIGGSVAVAALAGPLSRASRAGVGSAQGHVIFRLSSRGQRGSRAAKLHNANMRFVTAAAADIHRAHPGDHSRIVQLTINDATFQRLFPSPNIEVADLRKVTLGCIGDCDRDTHVTIDEILGMVNNALGNPEVPVCGRGDLNRDGQITIEEILTAVNNAQQGCG